MKRIALFVLTMCTGFALVPATAQAPVYMTHNNSLMWAVFYPPTGIEIFYEDPRDGLEAIGVYPGTLLFGGEMYPYGPDGDRVEGTARIFKAGCNPALYYVEGYYDYTRGEIVLQGEAPVFAQGRSCQISHYEYNHNSTLVFTLIGH